MRLEWAQYSLNSHKLKYYVADGTHKGEHTFQWVGKVFKVAYNATDWMGQIHRTGEYQAFGSLEEAKAWVTAVVRMGGMNG